MIEEHVIQQVQKCYHVCIMLFEASDHATHTDRERLEGTLKNSTQNY